VVLTGNYETNPLNLIIPALKFGHCNITLPNHDIIRLIGFVSKIRVRLHNEFCH
jgi:hypothetical protein